MIPSLGVVQKSEEKVVRRYIHRIGQAPSGFWLAQKNAKRKSSPWQVTSDSAGRYASSLYGLDVRQIWEYGGWTYISPYLRGRFEKKVDIIYICTCIVHAVIMLLSRTVTRTLKGINET